MPKKKAGKSPTGFCYNCVHFCAEDVTCRIEPPKFFIGPVEGERHAAWVAWPRTGFREWCSSFKELDKEPEGGWMWAGMPHHADEDD